MNTQVMFSSASDDWATPDAFFKKLDDEFAFDIDVCASEKNAKCKKYFTILDDGLSQEWAGTCWMNPPYGKVIGEWIKKAYNSAKNGAVIVGLLPARTDTKWFHEYIYGKAEIRFVRGRLKFGGCKNSAPFPSMVVIWGNGYQEGNR